MALGFFLFLLRFEVEHFIMVQKLRNSPAPPCLLQKFHRAFACHHDIFYLSLENKSCAVILKEAYNDSSSVETHPILGHNNCRRAFHWRIGLHRVGWTLRLSEKFQDSLNLPRILHAYEKGHHLSIKPAFSRPKNHLKTSYEIDS